MCCSKFKQRHQPGGRAELGAGQLRRAVERTRARLTDLRQDELRQVAPHEWEAAVQAARTSLTGAGVDLVLVFEAELDPDRLARVVEARGAATLQRAGLDEGGEAAYHQLIALTCGELIAFFRSLPQFEEVLQTRTFWRVSDVARQLDALLQSHRTSSRIEDAAFTARYARVVADALGQFELFGVTRGRMPRRHTFDKPSDDRSYSEMCS